MHTIARTAAASAASAVVGSVAGFLLPRRA